MKRTLVLLLFLVTLFALPLSASAQIQKTADIGTVNSQTGTSYTFVFSDRGKLVTFSNGSAVSVTLPQATAAGNFRSGWTSFVYNLGAGTVTITPTTSTINGAASIALATGEGATIFSNGSNYLAFRTTVSTIANKIHETSDPVDLTVGAILDGEILIRSGGTIASIPLPEGGSGGIGTVTTTGSPANGNLAKFSGATSITNGDLSGDVTTSGTLATTIANSAVTNAKIANGTIDLTTKVTGALPAINITPSVLDGSVWYCADAGSNDTYACSLTPSPLAYITGAHYRFKANTANTGSATINFNSLGAKTIKKLHDQDLADNDIEVGSMVDLVYDGTNMQMQSQIANSSAGGGGSTNPTDKFIPYNNAGTFADSPLVREGANEVAQRNSTTAQTFNLYQSFTDTSNYSRLRAGSGGGTFALTSEALGTGTQQNFTVSVGTKDFIFNTGALLQGSGDGLTLGTSSTPWTAAYASDVTLADAGILKFGTGGSQIKGNIGSAGPIGFFDFLGNGTAWTGGEGSNGTFGGITQTFNASNTKPWQRVTSVGTSTVTGWTNLHLAGVWGRWANVDSVATDKVVIAHENTGGSSAAADRFNTNTGSDIELVTGEIVDFIYDGSSSRWRAGKFETSFDARLASDATNATTTMSNLTELSRTVANGYTYAFTLTLYLNDSVAADGVKIDFDGGSATVSAFRCHCNLFDTALLLSSQTSALATDFAQGTATGDSIFECHGAFTASSTGTFIPRFAQNAHTSGTLTAYKLSNLRIQRVP